jgi:uncharacterized membrane protein YjfL (UPF0719 family)
MDWATIAFISVATLALLVVARLVNQFFMHEQLTASLTTRDNAALGLSLSGYLFGVMMIITDVLSGPGHGEWLQDALWVSVYGIGGILFLVFVGTIELRWIVSGDALKSVREGNTAAGMITMGSYIATSLIIAATVSGEGSGGTWVTAIVFFLVGQITLLLVTYGFRLLTAYDDSSEIMNGNTAAALSYAGLMIAVAIVVGNAIRGEFVDYRSSLTDYARTLTVVVALYPIRQFLVQGILLGGGFSLYGGRLDEEIRKDRNMSAAALEALTYIGAAILATRLV